jgi:hypothetical protein
VAKIPDWTSPKSKPELSGNSEDGARSDDGRNVAVGATGSIPAMVPELRRSDEKNKALESNFFESAKLGLSENGTDRVGELWMWNCGTVRLSTSGNGDQDHLKAGHLTGIAQGLFSGWLGTDTSGMKAILFVTRSLKKTDEGNYF